MLDDQKLFPPIENLNLCGIARKRFIHKVLINLLHNYQILSRLPLLYELFHRFNFVSYIVHQNMQVTDMFYMERC
jgi:hypothetical protein